MQKWTKCWRTTGIGLMLLFLMTLLTSCVTLRAPPAQYLEDCATTYLPPGGEVGQGDVVRLAVAREYDVKLCNADKAALKAWYEGYCDAAGWRCRLKYGSD